MTRIYTKTGDDGTTGLIGGKRVSKDTLRVEAYGTMDELNAILGQARTFSLPARVDSILCRMQDDLFTIGAELAVPDGIDPTQWGVPGLREEDILGLEQAIDACDLELEPLHRFILPGGTQAAALLHLARAVARRAERRCVALSHAECVDPRILRYINRVSDLCFVLARYVNHLEGRSENHPNFGERR